VTRERLYFVMLTAWVVFTLTLTSIPNPQFGPTFHGADTVAHFGFYGGVGVLFVLWRRESGTSAAAAVLWAILFAAVLGAVDEFHQQWIPGRSMEFFDWVADFTGGSTGALIATFAVSRISSLLTRKNQPDLRAFTD
jgi:VanZ family protein